MKIVVNTGVALSGGSITHLRNLLPRLIEQRGSDELIAIGNTRTREATCAPRELSWIDADVDFARQLRRFRWENVALPRILRRLGADVLFHPSNVPVCRSPVPQVNLIHNLGPFVPEVIAEESAFQRLRLRLIRALSVRSLRTADRTIFVSEWGKERILEAAGVDCDPGPVIYFGSDHAPGEVSDAPLERWELSPGTFILSVSHFYRYKRLRELVEAYTALGEQVKEIPLVLAGQQYDRVYTEAVRAAAQKAPGRVVLTGSLGPGDVDIMMRSCLVFAFTSTVENLPITLLEAMEAGAPIVTSRACSMPEVCGDAALYVDEPSAPGYARALRKVITDPALRADLRRRGRERSARFRWSETARRTLEILREVARDGRAD